MAPKIIISSIQSKLPRDFNKFLANGENKTRLIELVRSVLIDKKESILADLKCDGVYFSSYRECIIVTKNDVVLVPDLCSNQEEADTKVILHADHALSSNDEGIAIIRSHYGDTDIAVIAMSHFNENGDRVILDANTGKYRKAFKLSDIDLTATQKLCLVGFHAFTGNDYNSALFRKGKRMCWKLLERKPRFVDTFGHLTYGDQALRSRCAEKSIKKYQNAMQNAVRSQRTDWGRSGHHLVRGSVPMIALECHIKRRAC